MNTIKIIIDDKLKLYTPYHKNLPARARKIGGKWEGDCWVFDCRDEDRVRDLCVDIYGTDGSEKYNDFVDVRLKVKDSYTWEACQTSLFLFGKMIARATDRDGGATLGDGVIIIDGHAPTSGGSAKYWKTIMNENTIFEIRDVVRIMLDKKKLPEDLELIKVIEHKKDKDIEKTQNKKDELSQAVKDSLFELLQQAVSNGRIETTLRYDGNEYLTIIEQKQAKQGVA